MVELGELPRGATVRSPLPAGVVWAPGAAGAGPRLDLRAPLGYGLGNGAVRPVSFRLPADATRAQATAAAAALTRLRVNGGPLPASLRLDVPPLAPCQVLLPGERNATCRAAAGTR